MLRETGERRDAVVAPIHPEVIVIQAPGETRKRLAPRSGLRLDVAFVRSDRQFVAVQPPSGARPDRHRHLNNRYQRRALFFAFFLGRLVGMTFFATFLALLATDFAAFFALRVTRLYIDFLAIAFPLPFGFLG
jgi:hypothetical protein